MKRIAKILLPVFIFTALCGVEGCDEELLARLKEAQQKQLQANGAQGISDDAFSRESTDFYTSADLFSHLEELETSGELITADQCTSLIETTPRGVACLHCTQPEARDQAMILASILNKSCLQNIAINYLVDGTFDFDAQLIIDQLALLSEGDRNVFAYFYLTNGATARRWETTQIDAFATQIPPEKFRALIQTDYELRAEYQKLVMRLLPVLEAASELGVQASLVLGLEDNLTITSFEALYDLTIETLPMTLPVAIGRNPCPGCYPGNDTVIPAGVFEEVHTINSFTKVSDGLITNDGRNYDQDNIEELSDLRDRATQLNSSFILWSAERQGLDNYDGTSYPLPSLRNYEIPSIEQQKEIIYFLRGF